MSGSGWAGSAQIPCRVYEREEKKGELLKEEERCPGPQIYGRSPPLSKTFCFSFSPII